MRFPREEALYINYQVYALPLLLFLSSSTKAYSCDTRVSIVPHSIPQAVLLTRDNMVQCHSRRCHHTYGLNVCHQQCRTAGQQQGLQVNGLSPVLRSGSSTVLSIRHLADLRRKKCERQPTSTNVHKITTCAPYGTIRLDFTPA